MGREIGWSEGRGELTKGRSECLEERSKGERNNENKEVKSRVKEGRRK